MTGLVRVVFNKNLEDCIKLEPSNSMDPTNIIKAIDKTLKMCNNISSLLYANRALTVLTKNANKTNLFNSGQREEEEDARINKLFNLFDRMLRQPIVHVNTDSNLSTKSLENFNQIIHAYATSPDLEIYLQEKNDWANIIQGLNIIMMIINPHKSNITGLAIYRKSLRQPEKSFKDFRLRKLFGNENAHDIFDTKFEAGIIIPQTVMKQVTSTMTNIRIVFSIFYKDSWFLDGKKNGTDGIAKVKNKIIGVSIPQYPDAVLPDGINAVFSKHKNFQNRFIRVDDSCSNWIMGSNKGEWNKLFYHQNNLAENLQSCNIKQATFAGYLRYFGNDKIMYSSCDTQLHDTLISVMSIVICSISIVCIVIMFVMAWKIEIWRSCHTTPLILHLAGADGLQMLFFILIVELKLLDPKKDDTLNLVYCFISGAILHYFTLVGFFLSLFATDHLTRTYIIATPTTIPPKFKTKVITFGWILPMLLVGLFVAVDIYFEAEIYLPTDVFHDKSSICYPVGDFLVLSVHTPIVIAIALHLIIFISIIVRTNQYQENLITNIKRIREKCGTYIYAVSLLSITWISAVVAYYTDNCWIRVIFSYLFVITATSRGLLMFFSCVVFNGQIRHYFKRIYRNYNY